VSTFPLGEKYVKIQIAGNKSHTRKYAKIMRIAYVLFLCQQKTSNFDLPICWSKLKEHKFYLEAVRDV